MGRRPPETGPQPPARLLEYDPADWLPLAMADPAGKSLEQRARHLWVRARMAWAREYGWPGGLDAIDLLQQAVNDRRRAVQDAFRQQHG